MDRATFHSDPTTAHHAGAPGGVAVERRRAPGAWVRRAGPTAGVSVLLLLAPLALGEFELSLLAEMLVLGVLAVSVDLLVGLTGLPTLGQAAYYGVGGYAAALVALHLTSNAPVQLLVAVVAGMAAAALSGWVAVRTSGIYFLMLTLAVGQTLYSLAVSLREVTGGSDGLAGIPPPTLLGPETVLAAGGPTYYFLLLAAAVATAAALFVARSQFGLVLRGIRQNEQRMRALGYPTPLYKYGIFVLAGGFAGLAGSLQVTLRSYFSPDELLFQVSALALFAVLIGGRATIVGGFAGAGVIILVRDDLAAGAAGHAPLLLGLLFVVVVYLLPGGLAAILRRGAGWWRARTSTRAEPSPQQDER